MSFGGVWSAGAEAGLLKAYCRAGGLVTAGIQAFLGGVDWEAGLFAVVLLEGCIGPVMGMMLIRFGLCCRVKSVADVLRSIRHHGFSQER